MSDSVVHPTYNDLMARVGFLLVQWGFLEYAMKDSNQDIARLRQIAELDEARRLRNLVAHGICRASADPSASREPFVSCIDQDGRMLDISYSTLQQATDALERYRLRNFRPPRSK